jgi:uncharacterized protein DUF1016
MSTLRSSTFTGRRLRFISHKFEAAEWGDGVVDPAGTVHSRAEPGLRGFTRRNLFRMRQFYEAYRNDSKVSPLVTQFSGLTTSSSWGRANARKSVNSICDSPSGRSGVNVNWSASSGQLCFSRSLNPTE